jgi:hypothetical protein
LNAYQAEHSKSSQVSGNILITELTAAKVQAVKSKS